MHQDAGSFIMTGKGLEVMKPAIAHSDIDQLTVTDPAKAFVVKFAEYAI
ncbi:MAG: hypothetical protein H7122_13995 [Chitinophagaceae bacterium]|nr:hypothetical protein [Chitinophagaceae bacterium]